MIRRSLNPNSSNSFFIFGPRGTGKTTFIENQFLNNKKSWGIDLLDSENEELFSRDPKFLEKKLNAMKNKPEWIFIDEVQKIPKLLNHVHRLIEQKSQKFILSGSSSRKLKTTGANLLAGRAFVYKLFPFTIEELKDKWNFDLALNWGTLPKTYFLKTNEERILYLKSYLQTYIREEIRLEQVLRNLDPFREFLEVAAQLNGEPLNYLKIALDVGTTDKTIKSYYQILEDTFLGFHLPAFHRSVRKAQLESPKFYFFDLGVKRALEGSLLSPLVPGTSNFGQGFEHLVMLEAFRNNINKNKDYRFSFFRSKEGQEIDLIISPNRNLEILVEIKSYKRVDEKDAKKLENLSKEFNAKGLYLLSLDKNIQKIGKVRAMPWDEGLKEIFS